MRYPDPLAAADALDDARNRFAARRRPELRRLLNERPLTATVDAGAWSEETGAIPVGSDFSAWMVESIDDHERALAEALFDPLARARYVGRYAAARAAAEADALGVEYFGLEAA